LDFLPFGWILLEFGRLTASRTGKRPMTMGWRSDMPKIDGVMRRSAFKIGERNRMIDINIRGVLHGIAAVLPRMEAQVRGRIVNVSSVGGFVVQPSAAVYAATRFAVRAISAGLRKESDKIGCACVYPGVVESELAETISNETARERMKSYRRMAIQPDAIGRAILYAIEQPNDVDVNEIVVRPLATQV
jgi:NADP-dependent 3-hydroxy acid dehydrogenase YdfG